MTLKDIKELLTDLIKNEWLKFAEEGDKEYFIKEIRQANKEEMEEVLSNIESSKIIGGEEYIYDIRGEYDSIC